MSIAAPGLRAGFTETVAQATAELSVATFPERLRAIVLTGSLARGEGTWIPEGRRTRLAGDAECLLIFEARATLPRAECIAKLIADVEARLAAEGIDAHVGLSPVKPDFLRDLQPHIFAYELIQHGRVIWGDSDILGLAPTFRSAEIPLEDGFRMLSNRMIEMLEVLVGVEEGGTLPETTGYRAVKLWLDMATSFLLFEGRYETTYRARAARLQDLAAAPAHCPVPLGRFAERVTAATQCKLDQRRVALCDDSASLTRLIDDVRSLWRWELERLTGGGAGTRDRELLRRWMASQPVTGRLRGWASVGRRWGMVSSAGQLPKWLAQARTASPRRLIYSASAELFFAVPDLLYGAGCRLSGDSRWNELRRQLPVQSAQNERGQDRAWRKLGRAIVWNYHHFLELTRS